MKRDIDAELLAMMADLADIDGAPGDRAQAAVDILRELALGATVAHIAPGLSPTRQVVADCMAVLSDVLETA